MKPVQKLMALAGAGLLGALLVPTSDAQTTQTRPRSSLAITEPTEVPGGVVLPPGNYLIKVTDNQSTWNVVSITDPFEKKTFATILATPHTAKDSAPNSMFVFFNTPTGQNKVLRSWWPSNDRWGQDFVYPKARAAELARVSSEQVPEMTSDMSQYESTHRTDTPATTPTDTSAQNAYSSTATTTPSTDMNSAPTDTTPAPSTAQDNTGSAWRTDRVDTSASNQTTRTADTTTAATDTDTSTRRANLPRTASPFPLLALAGAASLGLGLAVRRYAA